MLGATSARAERQSVFLSARQAGRPTRPEYVRVDGAEGRRLARRAPARRRSGANVLPTLVILGGEGMTPPPNMKAADDSSSRLPLLKIG